MLHVLEAVGGGTAKHLVDLVSHVRGVRHVAAVSSHRVGGLSDDGIVPRLRAAGATVHVVPMQRSPVAPPNGLAVLRLRRLLRDLAPSVVHAHASIAGAVARLALLGNPTPLLWTPHAISTGRVYSLAERLLFRTATVVALSDSERDLIARLGVAAQDALLVIPNGVDRSAAAPPFGVRGRLGLPPGARLVGTVARLVPQKAPLDFVHTCAHVALRMPDVHFVIVGDGPLAGAVDRLVHRLGLAGRFHRLSVPTEAAAVIAELDAFVLCSRYEGGPYTPLEAMVAGVPVVVSGCVGSRDTVVDGATGLVAEPGDVAALADALTRVLADEVLRARLCRQARQRLTTHFDVADMARQYTQLYRRQAGFSPYPAETRRTIVLDSAERPAASGALGTMAAGASLPR